MTRAAKLLISSGILVALVPFLGFPGIVKEALMIALGLFVVFTAYLSEQRIREKEDKRIRENTPHVSWGGIRETDVFSESIPRENTPLGGGNIEPEPHRKKIM